jgi:hypothetical protein
MEKDGLLEKLKLVFVTTRQSFAQHDAVFDQDIFPIVDLKQARRFTQIVGFQFLISQDRFLICYNNRVENGRTGMRVYGFYTND